jgi:hypothetical protein
MGDRMYATARVLQRPHPLSRYPKRGDQHSSLILRRLGRMGGAAAALLAGRTPSEGSPLFCGRVTARQGVAG